MPGEWSGAAVGGDAGCGIGGAPGRQSAGLIELLGFMVIPPYIGDLFDRSDCRCLFAACEDAVFPLEQASTRSRDTAAIWLQGKGLLPGDKGM
jgi:hypothetical protein